MLFNIFINNIILDTYSFFYNNINNKDIEPPLNREEYKEEMDDHHIIVAENHISTKCFSRKKGS